MIFYTIGCLNSILNDDAVCSFIHEHSIQILSLTDCIFNEVYLITAMCTDYKIPRQHLVQYKFLWPYKIDIKTCCFGSTSMFLSNEELHHKQMFNERTH